MQDFFDFYQFGGFFNNIVSLFGLAALATLVMHLAGTRRPGTEPLLLRLSERFAGLGVAAGVLGVMFNMIEMSAALSTVSAELFMPAMNRALSIVPIPLAWSLMCAIPIWLATTCLRHRTLAAA